MHVGLKFRSDDARVRSRGLLRCLATALALGGLGALVSGCSSGGSSGSGTPQNSVVVAGAAATRLGATTQFAATVTGTSNSAVVWQVNGVAGGAAATGTISASGLYTAPTTMPANTSVAITAVSAALSLSGSETEQLENPVPLVSSSTATQVGTTLSYTVDVQGSGFVPTSTIQVNGAAVTTVPVSATELQATVTLPASASSIAVVVSNPDPGAVLSAAMNVPVAYVQATATQAARILDQTTFGPTATAIQHVQGIGLNAYLAEQFATPTTTLAAIPTNPLPALCLTNNNPRVCAESEWWQTAINGPDQLRQRVAFALSEMFVVSSQSISGAAIPQFHNALANDAFGNFATIMKDVALSPAMGGYLNMLNSAAPGAGQIANENFARENMQLFTIGLAELNQDGTPQLDGSGNPIPTYAEAQVQAFARAYTGWTYANATGGAAAKFPNGTPNYAYPMAAVESAHDTTSKTLLNGTVLSAGQTAEADLNGALTNIFNHPNVGPFVCTQLIQHLVTSTPSPAYVSRVAAVFANDGNGVRGNMQAVITAILTDQEARAADTDASYNGGHLREPILFITAMMRALGYTNTAANGSYFTLSNYSSPLNEDPYFANSVFNFFPPNYVIPGTTLNAPEFDIENTATVTLRLTLANAMVNNAISGFSVDLSNTSPLGTMAANPGALVDDLSMLFLHSQMSPAMRTTIVNTITPLTSNAQRVRVAVFLVVTSSQYKVIQ